MLNPLLAHCQRQYSRTRREDALAPVPSKQFSPALTPLPRQFLDSLVTEDFSGISLADRLADLFKLPLLNVKVICDGFIEQISPVSITSLRERVERIDLGRLKPETDCLLFHMI